MFTKKGLLIGFRKLLTKDMRKLKYNLGLIYSNGFGSIEKDSNKSFEWYRTAAESKHPDAIYNTGTCHFHGTGVEEHKVQTIYWYQGFLLVYRRDPARAKGVESY
jgi:L-rhamnose isomerase